MEAGILNDGLLAETERRVQREVDDATDYAERAPLADPSTVMHHVYAEAA
jgi:2-oxoisovalerate dehydrogenase E1 component alpha subunit